VSPLPRPRFGRPGKPRARVPAHAAGADVDHENTLRLPPIFVGGTGRSGTTITARLLDAHPAYHMIRTEVRFIAASGGLCDLADGRTAFPAFEERLLDLWFERGPTSGLHVILDRDAVERALPHLRDGLASDPWRAAGRFAHQLLDPVAARHGAAGWIEMTPANVRSPATLLRIFPTMRLVHSVRDGRDVAASVVRMWWGPNDLDEALDWWAAKLARAFKASGSLPPDRVHVVRMEDLTVEHRDREYRRLLDFVGLEDDPAMRSFFETTMMPDRAHLGRWRDDVPPDRLAEFEAHYERLARRLAGEGHPYVADTRAGAREPQG
jgi:hypothetical protein